MVQTKNRRSGEIAFPRPPFVLLCASTTIQWTKTQYRNILSPSYTPRPFCAEILTLLYTQAHINHSLISFRLFPFRYLLVRAISLSHFSSDFHDYTNTFTRCRDVEEDVKDAAAPLAAISARMAVIRITTTSAAMPDQGAASATSLAISPRTAVHALPMAMQWT